MFKPGHFTAHSIRAHPRRAAIQRILAAALRSAHAGEAVKRYLQAHPLPVAKRTFALGLGKAACNMTSALSPSIDLAEALVITKHASFMDYQPATVIEADHPIPGGSSLRAGRAALGFVSRFTPDDLLICLISGGGSALMTAPLIPLAELQTLTSSLLACGARIDEINTLRRHLDLLKGGGLAQAAKGSRIVSLILSDVVGDPLEAIASGPTAPDPSTREDAVAIIQKYRLDASIISSFRETAKPADPVFEKVENHIIASNDFALRAALDQARQEGFQAEIIRSGMQGEARDVGHELAEALRQTESRLPRPFCLLAGGETTVTLGGDGKGGRNQELVLGAVETLRSLNEVMLISIATDGEDGPTDAAGAAATGESAQRAEALGMAAAAYLSRNDAYPYFAALDDLIKTGPSGTNVNDLVFLFAL